MTTNKIVKEILTNLIKSNLTQQDIQAIEHSGVFHGKDAGEYILEQLDSYGTPIYGANGEVVRYEINKQNVLDGIKNKIDEKR